jgi:beta-galactosidase
VPWSPGVLRVVASKPGTKPVVKEVKTAGPAARVALVADRSRLSADGEDLSFVTVRIEDKDGTLCPLAEDLVRFELTGPARIAAVDNGDSATTESFRGNSRHAFNGMALVVIRTERGRPGQITVSASSDGLRPASVTLTSSRQRAGSF